MAVACAAVALGLVACRNVLNQSNDTSFHIRMVNLLEDSPTVQYSIDSTVVSSSAYPAATGLSPGHPGDRAIAFAALRPPSLSSSDSTDPIPLGGSFTQSYAQGRDYTVFAYGTLNNPKTFVMDEPSGKAAVDDDFIEYQFVNVASNAPAVDIYITAPDGQINSPQLLTTLNLAAKTDTTKLKLFKRADVTDPNASLIVDLTIELRDPTTGAELFNSGKLRFTEKTRLLWAITNNPGPGPSKFRLLGIDGSTGLVLSTTDQAQVRVAHVSADSTNFDIYQGSSLTTPIAQNLAFRSVSPYMNVNTGDVDLLALPAGSTAVTILFVKEFSAVSNGTYTAYAAGPQGSVDGIVLQDDRRSVPTQSRFRFFSAAPSQNGQDPLDIYVTLPGQSLDFTASTSVTTDDAAQFKRGSISYRGAATDYAVLKSGTYEVRMAPAGTSRIVLDQQITVVDGSVATYTLLDDLTTASLELMPVEEALTP